MQLLSFESAFLLLDQIHYRSCWTSTQRRLGLDVLYNDFSPVSDEVFDESAGEAAQDYLDTVCHLHTDNYLETSCHLDTNEHPNTGCHLDTNGFPDTDHELDTGLHLRTGHLLHAGHDLDAGYRLDIGHRYVRMNCKSYARENAATCLIWTEPLTTVKRP
jgi:hypothetical protein